MKSTRNKLPRTPCSLLALALLSLVLSVRAELLGQEAEEPPSSSELAAQAVLLGSRFHADREGAIETLASAGTPAAELLENAATSDNPQEQACALRALCRADPARAATLLVEAVQHDSIGVRVAAARAASALGVEGAKALLARARELPSQKRPALRAIIASACRKSVEEILTKIVSSPEGRGQFPGQYRQITSLGHVVEPALSAIAADPSHPVAEAAASALGELGDKAAVPALKKAYLSGGRRLKGIAAAALHTLGEDGPYKEVIARYEKEWSKGSLGVYSELALFYDRAREYEKGEKVLKKLIAKAPAGGMALTHINLACMLSIQNKVEEAFAEFVKGVEKGYNDMVWVKIDAELANLRATRQFQEYVRAKFPQDFKEPENPKPDGEDK